MKLFALLMSLFIFETQALEIQCHTSFTDVDLVVKKSDASQHTYLLMMTETGVEKYWILEPTLYSYNETIFDYRDEDTQLHIDVLNGLGHLSAQGPIFRGQAELNLSNCLKTD